MELHLKEIKQLSQKQWWFIHWNMNKSNLTKWYKHWIIQNTDILISDMICILYAGLQHKIFLRYAYQHCYLDCYHISRLDVKLNIPYLSISSYSSYMFSDILREQIKTDPKICGSCGYPHLLGLHCELTQNLPGPVPPQITELRLSGEQISS